MSVRGPIHGLGMHFGSALARSGKVRLESVHADHSSAIMSYQGEAGLLELRAWREPLETSAALHLGQLLFGFSRLDLSIQRYLDVARPTSAFRDWMARVHELEGLRAALASGQWIPDARSDRIIYEPGPGGTRVEHRLHELEAAVELLRQLQSQLHVIYATERGLGRAAAEAFLATQPIEVLA